MNHQPGVRGQGLPPLKQRKMTGSSKGLQSLKGTALQRHLSQGPGWGMPATIEQRSVLEKRERHRARRKDPCLHQHSASHAKGLLQHWQLPRKLGPTGKKIILIYKIYSTS